MKWKKLGVQKLFMIHSTLIQNDDLNDYIQNWMLALSLLCIKYAKKVVVCRYLTFELRKMSWFPIHEIAKKYFHANCIFIIDRNCRHHIFCERQWCILFKYLTLIIYLLEAQLDYGFIAIFKRVEITFQNIFPTAV